MGRLQSFAIAIFLTVGAYGQTTSNDVGISVQGRAGGAASVGKPLLATPRNGGALPPCSSGVTAFSGSNSQMGRIFRDSLPSSCPGKAYPGIFNPR